MDFWLPASKVNGEGEKVWRLQTPSNNCSLKKTFYGETSAFWLEDRCIMSDTLILKEIKDFGVHHDENAFIVFVRPQTYTQWALVTNTECKQKLCFKKTPRGTFKKENHLHSLFNQTLSVLPCSNGVGWRCTAHLRRGSHGHRQPPVHRRCVHPHDVPARQGHGKNREKCINSSYPF